MADSRNDRKFGGCRKKDKSDYGVFLLLFFTAPRLTLAVFGSLAQFYVSINLLQIYVYVKRNIDCIPTGVYSKGNKKDFFLF